MELSLLLFILPPLVIIQTIVGVGVLVLGTPILLLLNYNIIETISLLLPISILTSLINITTYSKYKFMVIDKKKYKYFFLICIPGIFLGLKLLEIYQNTINFELLVSLIIIISLLFKLKSSNKFKKISNIKKKFFILSIGVIHGLTNAGGSILALFITRTTFGKNKINYEISLFYFLLATIQYFIFLFIFRNSFHINYIIEIFVLVIIFVFIGKKISKFLNYFFFQILINVIVLISALSLIFKNIFF